MAFMHRLLARSVATRVYALVLMLAVVSLAIAVGAEIGISQHLDREAEVMRAAQAVALSERMNGLISAVVMDSRGLYMSKTQP